MHAASVYRVHRSIDVSFSHHVRGHAGPCVNVHGHTWKFEVGLAASELDRQGFVVDFAILSAHVLKPVHGLLDHALAMGRETFEEVSGPLSDLGKVLLASREAIHGSDHGIVDDQTPRRLGGAENRYPGGLKVCVFPFSPTSERLAKWLFDLADGVAREHGPGRVAVAHARVYETLHPVESVAEYRSG
ncbi:MAG: 6-pyruvoyl tetrahydropterin synthase family protein [Myxococcota bacterium]